MNKEYFYRKRILELSKQLEVLEVENKKKDQIIFDLLHSKSWQITKPFRLLSSCFSKKDILDVLESDDILEYDYHDEPSYESHYEEDLDFRGMTPLVKTIAFYLPQFHPILENDEWWGKGFTEWTNTLKSKPLFDGHYMPRVPHDDIGYYNLLDIEVLKKQVLLAKKHGIYGFCFYYYWFSGKRLLEKPVDLLLEHKKIDFPFCLCWANENWTRTWDGLEKDILISQEYKSDDPIHFIMDLKKYFMDERYIKIEGHPLIMVYNPKAIPSFSSVCELWRKTAKQVGIGDIVIWSKSDIGNYEPIHTSFVDGEFDFAPHGFSLPNDRICGIEGDPLVVNYSKLVPCLWETYQNHYPLKPFSYSVTMGWDNSARRQKGYKIYYHYSLKAFYLWILIALQKMHQNDFSQTFLFVNAWNEWGEGTYLEPDKKYGYANINTLSKAIHGIFLESDFKILNQKEELLCHHRKIAVQCHVYYVDLLPEILDFLSHIPVSFSLFISTVDEERKIQIETVLHESSIENFVVEVFENRGRDILPMLMQMKSRIHEYDYFLHLHTKKSKTITFGEEWRKYLLYHLLGSRNAVIQILNELERDDIGLIYPKPFSKAFYFLMNSRGSIGGNEDYLKLLFSKLNLSYDLKNKYFSFPMGSMFFAKVDAIIDLFLKFDESCFCFEDSQVDQTYAHAIERCFDFLARSHGYQSLLIYNAHDSKLS